MARQEEGPKSDEAIMTELARILPSNVPEDVIDRAKGAFAPMARRRALQVGASIAATDLEETMLIASARGGRTSARPQITELQQGTPAILRRQRPGH